MFQIPKFRRKSDLGLCTTLELAKRMQLRGADFRLKNSFGRKICRNSALRIVIVKKFTMGRQNKKNRPKYRRIRFFFGTAISNQFFVKILLSQLTLSTAMNLVHRNSFPKLSNFS